MDIDYYQTPEQQETAFERYNGKSCYSLLDLFAKVNLHWGGATLFGFNKGTDDRVTFTFFISAKEHLKMVFDPQTSEQEHDFKELARQNIRTVKGVLDFLDGSSSKKVNKKEKYISLYNTEMVIREVSNKYFKNLIDFLHQVKRYSCPEMRIDIIPYIASAGFTFHFERHIRGYRKPLTAFFRKTEATQEELKAYHNLFEAYMLADKKMTIQRAIDILDPPDDSREEKEAEGYNLTDDGTGKKYDNGKPMAGTLTDVFSRALMAVGACIEFGTHKYPNPKNWQLVDNGIKRYRDAMVRHLLKYNAGIDKDEETKLPHLAHMAWNALAILELYMQEHKDKLDKEIFK